MIQKLITRYQSWKLDRRLKKVVDGLRLVQIQVDGGGEDATVIGLTASGQFFRCQMWTEKGQHESGKWEELATPQSEFLSPGWMK
jgi:hypothetical protein